MQVCRITIATTIDGNTTEITRDGFCSLSLLSAKVCYEEDGAKVRLGLENGVVTINRIGDYTLSLTLIENKICDGVLGINGAEGAIQVKTNKLAYSLTETSLLLSLGYTLMISGEPQEMKLRIFAKKTA